MTTENQLEAWLAQEPHIRAITAKGAGAGVATHAQIAGKNGLEVMQALLNGRTQRQHCESDHAQSNAGTG